MGIAAAVVALVVAAGSAVASSRQQKKAAAERRRAAEIARKRDELQLKRANFQNIEEYRQQVGQITNVAAQRGGLGSSGVEGGVSSLSAQLGANVTFNEQLQAFAESQGRALDRAAGREQKAQDFATLAKISLQVAGSV